MTRLSHGVEETETIAAELARELMSGGCIALEGELGAGKTQFVRGLVLGMGGNPRAVSSPTFVLLNVYSTALRKVYHLDAYRVQTAEDFESIGFSELLEQDGLVVVEWASRVLELLPQKRIDVNIRVIDENQRSIEIVHH